MQFTSIVALIAAANSMIVNAQGPQLCQATAQYSQCATDKANIIAACNSLVTDTPTFEYYNCVCNGQNSMISCYDICPDDPQLQAQKQSQLQYKSGTCVYVAQQKALGKGAPPVASSTTVTTGTSTTGVKGTSVALPLPKRTLPPAPVNNDTYSGGYTYNSGAATSFGLLLSSVMASAIVAVLAVAM